MYLSELFLHDSQTMEEGINHQDNTYSKRQKLDETEEGRS